MIFWFPYFPSSLQTNIAIENNSFIDDLPIKKGRFYRPGDHFILEPLFQKLAGGARMLPGSAQVIYHVQCL